MVKRFQERELIVTGDLNADVSWIQNPSNKQVANFLTSFGLVDLLGRFRQRLWFCHRQTWWQFLQGKLLRLHCNYVLGADCRLLDNVRIRDPRNFFSDHFALCNLLLRRSILCHG